MKASLKYVCYSLMLALVAFGCGKKDEGGGGGGGGTPYNAYGNYCANQPGTVPTPNCGCVPQGNCPAGQAMCNGGCTAQGVPNNGWNNNNCQPGMPNYPNCNTTCLPGQPGCPTNCLPGQPGCNTSCLPGQPGCGTGGNMNAQQMAQFICSMYGLQAFQTPWCPTGYACNAGYTYGCVVF